MLVTRLVIYTYNLKTPSSIKLSKNVTNKKQFL